MTHAPKISNCSELKLLDLEKVKYMPRSPKKFISPVKQPQSSSKRSRKIVDAKKELKNIFNSEIGYYRIICKNMATGVLKYGDDNTD
jgi:hypothetical protein